LNSKILICLALGLTLSSCGVKGPPVQYPDTIVDSYIKNYTGTEPTAEEIERKNNKDVIPSPLDQQQQKPVTKP